MKVKRVKVWRCINTVLSLGLENVKGDTKGEREGRGEISLYKNKIKYL